jgi:hypothetical protein
VVRERVVREIAKQISRIWDDFFFRGCSPELLGTIRIVVGAGMIPFHILQFASFFWFDLSGRQFYYIERIWYFELLGIESVHPVLTLSIFLLLIISTITFAMGRYTRTSLVVMLLCVVFLKGVRDSIAGDVHHRYLIPFHVLFFLLLSRCGDVKSYDRKRRDAKGLTTKIEEWEATWPIKASQIYICSFYLWGAIAKVRMSGVAWFEAERFRKLLLDRNLRFSPGDDSSFGYWLAQNEMACSVIGGATALFEFGFPLILLIKDTRLRLLFFAGVTGFHIANFFLASVLFLFLPIVFVIFFDITIPLKARRKRIASMSTGMV